MAGIDFSGVKTSLDAAVGSVQTQLKALQDASASGKSVGVSDMFQMQLLMNQLSQLSEMSTSVLSAANSSLMSMARNIKS